MNIQNLKIYMHILTCIKVQYEYYVQQMHLLYCYIVTSIIIIKYLKYF